MKQIILPILISIVLTVFCWNAELLFPSLDLILLPFMAALFIMGLSVFLTIPIGLYRLYKKQLISKWLTRFIGLSLGFYIGLMIQTPIDSWKIEQRNLSGQILSEELENYKILNGKYPDDLVQLDLDKVNDKLPKIYKIDKFTYYVRDSIYDLEIPIPLFDHWQWNKEKKEFVFEDF